MKKITITVEHIDHKHIRLTNENGDTFTSSSEELADFLTVIPPMPESLKDPAKILKRGIVGIGYDFKNESLQ